MKILVLTKRQYMGKDLLDDRFGRFRELPLALAQRGHHMEGLALSYRRRKETKIEDISETGDARVGWQSINLVPGLRTGLIDYFKQARSLIRNFQPDVIWAASDAYHAILGYRLAQTFRIKCVIDLYDNFEAFGATKIPGVLSWFRKAVTNADGVTCFSQRLAEYIISSYPRHKPTAIVESGFAPNLFYLRNQSVCRQQLALPQDVRIIGTAGALHPSRDIESLFRAYELLAAEDNRLHLILAGPRPRSLRIPSGPRVHDLKLLPHSQVPLLINSLDVAVVGYRDTAQGRYSFPQKVYEMLACQIPIIAASVGSVQDILNISPRCLFEPENPVSLAGAARFQLEHKHIARFSPPTWEAMAGRLETFFQALLGNTSGAEHQAPQ